MPFKFVTADTPNRYHFDEEWTAFRMQPWEFKGIPRYIQKWKRSDTTTIQIESTILPDNLSLVDKTGYEWKVFVWRVVGIDANYKIYECTIDVSNVPPGTYFLYMRIHFLQITWNFFTEPFQTGDNWPDTMLFKYRNSFNDFDVAFTSGVEFAWRCEAAIVDVDFKHERTAYADQRRSVKTLRALPYRVYKLVFGDPHNIGIAPYMVDIANRLLACDHVEIEGKQYETDLDANMETQRIRGYPYISSSIDIVEAGALSSTGKALAGNSAVGIVTAYNIETGFFGPGSLVPVTDIDKNE